MSYRDRLYRSYAGSGSGDVAPTRREDLSSRAPYLRWLVREHFPSCRDVPILDLGCGYGAIVHFAREAGYGRVEGVDVAPQQVEVARRLGIDGVRQGDLLEAVSGLEDGSFGAVVTFDVLEHLTRDELLDLGQQVHRVLQPGGRWIIHVPNGEGAFGARILLSDLTHETGFTRHSVRQLAAAVGFERVSCHEDPVIVHGLRSAVRWAIWQVAKLRLRLLLAAETGEWSRDVVLTQNLLAVAVREGDTPARVEGESLQEPRESEDPRTRS